jgi:YhcH/YjgK/YiaL family protein
VICASVDDLLVSVSGDTKGRWEKALRWLKDGLWRNTPEGRTAIEGSEIYVLRSRYRSKVYSECRFETHRLYADIQLVVSGKELLEVRNREGMRTDEAYSAEKDIEFLDGDGREAHTIILAYPQAVVLFPMDAHKPCIAPDNKPDEVEKIVVKVALE